MFNSETLITIRENDKMFNEKQTYQTLCQQTWIPSSSQCRCHHGVNMLSLGKRKEEENKAMWYHRLFIKGGPEIAPNEISLV